MPSPEPLVLDDSAEARAVLYDTIENQIRERNPPETAATLARLQSLGLSRGDAVRYLACVLSVEFFEIVEHQSSFDLARYQANLAALPALPYDDDTD